MNNTKEKIDWENIKKVFFVGIKGVGMMPLSLIANEYGYEVEGSDIAEEFITDEVLIENKIKVHEGFEENIVMKFFEGLDVKNYLVITTGAHGGYNNPQVRKAKDMGIKYLNQGQALGFFMTGVPFHKKTKGITVTGSHGKTTISAMCAVVLSELGLDPSYSVGTSRIMPLGPSGHLGNGELFVAEGDEYVGEPVFDKTPKILYQHPDYAIINNIDFDHPDIYKDMEDVKNVMKQFIMGMNEGGKLFLNADDSELMNIKNQLERNIEIITYGEVESDFRIINIQESVGSLDFSVVKNGNYYGEFSLQIPGIHNAKNAVPVIALLDSLGKSYQEVKKAIFSYKGSKRRMEKVGTTSGGALIIDDYGHHPVEIRSTIDAVKNFYNKKIVCVFQSHTYSRTRNFLDDFSNSFSEVDELVLLPIFKSARDTESDIISDEDFLSPFNDKLDKVFMAKSIEDAASYIKSQSYGSDFLVLTIGAGDVYKVGYEIKL